MKKAIKYIISILMLLAIFTFVDFASLKEELQDLSITTILVVIFGYILGQIISTYKWLTIARSAGVQASFPEALKSYFIGMYVNCFGLGVVGGDVARAMLISSKQPKKTEAISSVIADRAHGLLVLVSIAAFCAIALKLLGAYTKTTFLLAALSCVGVLLLVGWFFGPRILLKFIPNDHKLRSKIESVLNSFPKDRSTFLAITALSVIFHSIQILLHWYLASSIGVNLRAEHLLVAIPLVNIMSSLPISWNGLGVRENGYAVFLGSVMSPSQAIAMGAVWLGAVIVSSGAGGVLAFLTKEKCGVLEANEGAFS